MQKQQQQQPTPTSAARVVYYRQLLHQGQR
jgi:hypothetical protein